MDTQRRTTRYGPETERTNESVRSVRGQIPERSRQVPERGDSTRAKAAGKMDQGRAKLAGGMDRLGNRLERQGRSLERGDGFKRKGGRAVERAGQQVERGAAYLRTHQLGEIRSDAQFRIRERPLTSVAVALGAGYLLGRLFG